MRFTVAAIAVVALVTLIAASSAHSKPTARHHHVHSGNLLIPRKAHPTLDWTIKWQKRIIRHDRWVTHTRRSHAQSRVSFAMAQLRWTKRELQSSLSVLRFASHSGGHSSTSPQGTICFACWDRVHSCEAGSWNEVTGNGFYWGLQWVPSTWDIAADNVGLHHHSWYISHSAVPSRIDQIRAASTLALSNWPVCQSRYTR